jgi:hypothetical protein
LKSASLEDLKLSNSLKARQGWSSRLEEPLQKPRKIAWRSLDLFSRMPETAGVAFGFVKFFYDIQSGQIHLFNDHLSDAVSAPKSV